MVKIFKGQFKEANPDDSIFAVSKLLTRAYLRFLKDIDDMEQFNLVNKNYEMCLGLFRHSLCLIFGLQSVLDFKELDNLVEPCCTYLKGVYDFSNTKFKSEAVIQACSHCISMARNKAKES